MAGAADLLHGVCTSRCASKGADIGKRPLVGESQLTMKGLIWIVMLFELSKL